MDCLTPKYFGNPQEQPADSSRTSLIVVKAMSVIGESKAFALKGKVVDMATGIMPGIAFGKIVSSLVGDLVTPSIGVLVGSQPKCHRGGVGRSVVVSMPLYADGGISASTRQASRAVEQAKYGLEARSAKPGSNCGASSVPARRASARYVPTKKPWPRPRRWWCRPSRASSTAKGSTSMR